MKGKFFVMVGLPGSGKSTVAKAIAEATDGVVISLDDLRAEILGDVQEQSNGRLITGIAMQRIEQALKEGKTVVYDATCLKRAYRRNALKLRPYCKSITALVVDTDVEECVKRNAQRERQVPEWVIRDKAERWTPVEPTEGFDKIVHITDTHMDVKELLKQTR